MEFRRIGLEESQGKLVKLRGELAELSGGDDKIGEVIRLNGELDKLSAELEAFTTDHVEKATIDGDGNACV